MFKSLTRSGFLALLSLALPFSGSVAVGQGVLGGEFCEGLDPSSGLFSICLQAHSAANRIEHLDAVGANEKSIAKAQLALEEALGAYAELTQGGAVPGFDPPIPILAIAYINRDGKPGYLAGFDTLIAKITDEDLNDFLTPGVDIITTHRYPTNFQGGEHDFQFNSHVFTAVQQLSEEIIVLEYEDLSAGFCCDSFVFVSTADEEGYFEARPDTATFATSIHDDITGAGVIENDFIIVVTGSPSCAVAVLDPCLPVSVGQPDSLKDDPFIDVDIALPGSGG